MSRAPLEDELVNSRGAIVIVLNTAHVALRQALVNDKDDLGSHLCSKEDSFLGPVTTLRGTRARAGAGSIAVSLVLELGKVFREPQGLD